MILNTADMELATALVVTRAVTGVTQQELEKLLGMPASTLSKVENGQRDMPEAYLTKAWEWIEGAKYNG